MAILITRNQIPDSALTDLETLTAWCFYTLEYMSNKKTFPETEGVTSFVCEKSFFTSYLKRSTMSFRVNMHLHEDYATGAYSEFWSAVDPQFDGTIPDTYLQSQ